MQPLRFALGRRPLSLDPRRGVRPEAAIAIVAASIERTEDRKAVGTLAAACRLVDTAGRFAPAGLDANLISRPGRTVHAWLAWPSAAVTRAAISDGTCPLGLVALVVAGTPQSPPRFSIAWLLVHPEARRRGVATSLVAHALAHAESLGATQVTAETLSSWPAAVGFWRSVGCQQES